MNGSKTRKNNKKFCILIPAYNEEASLAQVIQEVKKYQPEVSMVVINDCSTDRTAEVATKEKVPVLNLPKNLGIGGAVQQGLRYALKHGFEYGIQVDADGQHDPMTLEIMINQVNPKVDLLIGSRFLHKTEYKSSFSRWLGNRVFALLIKLVTGQVITDSTSGFRIYGPRALAILAKYYPQDFPEPESIVFLLKNGYTIREVSIEMRQRIGGQSSVGFFKSIYLMVTIPLRIILSVFRGYPDYTKAECIT